MENNIMKKTINMQHEANIQAEGKLSGRKCKPVICLETGEVFSSMTDAAEYTEVTTATMSNHLTGRYRSVKGKQYIWGINKFTGKVNLGTKGFHVCGRLQDVFKNYDYDFHNRYFKVKALVKASDYRYMNPNNTVLVAKQVNFVEEITDAPETIAAKRASMQ